MTAIFRKETILVAIFLLFILLPVCDMILKLDRFKYLYENRELAKPPQLSFTISGIQKFPAKYTKYFSDHFGFRNLLVRANFIIRYDLLGVSPSKQVVIGKEGWLFYAGEGAIEDYRGITKFNAVTLDKWAKSLEMKRIWLEKQGIRYLFVVAPNKSTIYGEYLPDSYNRVRQKTALDELMEYLKQHTSVEVVDMRPALRAAKENQRIYIRTDSHWNEYGAFIAYQEIMKPVIKWFPSLRTATFDDFLIKKHRGGGGDLTSMIGGTDFIKEEYVSFKRLNGHSLKIENINDQTKSPVTVEHKDKTLPRAIVFRDSFLSWVAPFLAEHFHYSRFYWNYWNPWVDIEEMVNTQKPDIVIEEVVERLVKTGMADFVANPPKFIADGQR
jgi:hypothetical protein